MSAITASLKPARRSGSIAALFGANVGFDGGATIFRTTVPIPNRRMSLQARASGVQDIDSGSLDANGFTVTAQSPSGFRDCLKCRGKIRTVWSTPSLRRAAYFWRSRQVRGRL